MRNPERSPLEWVILGVLLALVATNITFLLLRRTAGPLIGVAFYLVLLVRTFRARQRDYRLAIVVGIVGLVAHLAEAAASGWSAYPALVMLNLVLPAILALSAWAAERRPPRAASSK